MYWPAPCRFTPLSILLWFRRDLRLCDNPALMASLEVGAPVIPVFIWSPKEEEGTGITVAMGGACKFDQGISGYSNTLSHVFIIVLDKILVCKALYSNCLNVSSLF